MLQVTLKDVVGAKSDLLSTMKQIPFATSLALNQTAVDVRDTIRKTIMPNVFDRPTPFTLNSMFIKVSTKRDLTTIIGIKEGNFANVHLNPQVYGGPRKEKRSEMRLRHKGILPEGKILIPTKQFRDKYGNVRGPQVVKMLSAIQASWDPATYSKPGKNRSGHRSKAWNAFFVKKYPNGIVIFRKYSRTRIVPFMYSADAANYNVLFPFDNIVLFHFKDIFPDRFAGALEYALSTAR